MSLHASTMAHPRFSKSSCIPVITTRLSSSSQLPNRCLLAGLFGRSHLAFERDVAETTYDANYEAALYWKKRIDVLRELIAREWNREGGYA